MAPVKWEKVSWGKNNGLVEYWGEAPNLTKLISVE
jgi:hypothetical protein